MTFTLLKAIECTNAIDLITPTTKTLNVSCKENPQMNMLPSATTLGPALLHLNIKNVAFFCGKYAEIRGKRSQKVWQVKNLQFKENIIRICSGRVDTWSAEVRGRVEYITDLTAVGALYHQECSINFRTKRKVPLCFSMQDSKRSRAGRPLDEEKVTGFLKVAQYLKENDGEQLTINDLIMKMEFTGGSAYRVPKMKAE